MQTWEEGTESAQGHAQIKDVFFSRARRTSQMALHGRGLPAGNVRCSTVWTFSDGTAHPQKEGGSSLLNVGPGQMPNLVAGTGNGYPGTCEACRERCFGALDRHLAAPL